MNDIASIKSENESLRIIQEKLLQWEKTIAPLTSYQNDIILTLSQISTEDPNEQLDDPEIHDPHKSIEGQTPINKTINVPIESTQEFLSYYNGIDDEIMEQFDDVYTTYFHQLANQSKECDFLLNEIDESIKSLTSLTAEYTFVSNKTSSLHTASENLLQDQNKLNETCDEIRRRLNYFTQMEKISQRLQNSSFSVSGDLFVETLNTIDDCLEYMKNNPKFKEAATYTIKYKQCLSKAINMMKNYVTHVLKTATDQVLTPAAPLSEKDQQAYRRSSSSSSDVAFALYYGKYQASAPRVKKISTTIEQRFEKSAEYEYLLSELHQFYLGQRAQLMSAGVDRAIKDLATKHKSDNCALVRSSCAFLVHVCQDEHRLFYQFFSIPSGQLTTFQEGLCTILYDTLRPFIIHINHLETLAEICSILRVEMLDEHVQQNHESLEAFGKIVFQLLQDVQERLVFRAHLYLQSDIQNYSPSSGDLAYPEKLEMMENIALSLQESQMQLKRSDSRSSMFSTTSQEVENINVAAEQQFKSRTGNSPADLHGMWYPTVRRTLVCLSRLYRCVDRPIFQGLSQEALTYCIKSVSSAASAISAKKTPLDGELFEIKHLLILREQIAPFRVDFTVKETSLDFSKVKTAAFELLQKRKQLFALGSNNALLEFLLDGTPQVKEQMHDSRKDVDRQLKCVCEMFIKGSTALFVGKILEFIQNVASQGAAKQTVADGGPAQQKLNLQLRQSPWAAPQQISSLIQESQRNVKSKLAGLQRSMQLYLANKDTEFILFRPIRNNIISAFVKLEQILVTNGYTQDDLIIVSCPSADQISVLLSSASIMAEVSNARKASVASIENERTRKISASSMVAEKKVSFDNSVAQVVPEEEKDEE